MTDQDFKFDNFGPFEAALSPEERNARLDRLGAAAGRVGLAAFIEMIHLTKSEFHAARNIGPLCQTLNRLETEERRALLEAYAASA